MWLVFLIDSSLDLVPHWHNEHDFIPMSLYYGSEGKKKKINDVEYYCHYCLGSPAPDDRLDVESIHSIELGLGFLLNTCLAFGGKALGFLAVVSLVILPVNFLFMGVIVGEFDSADLFEVFSKVSCFRLFLRISSGHGDKFRCMLR